MLFFFSPPALSKLGQARSSEEPSDGLVPLPERSPLAPDQQVSPTRVSSHPAAVRPAVGYCGQPLPEKGKV